MNLRIWPTAVCTIFLMAGSACTRPSSTPRVIVEIPSGFSPELLAGDGGQGRSCFAAAGDACVVPVPRNGKFVTSTLLTNSEPRFRNSGEGGGVGLLASIFKTGDGIPIGGKIEFLVGTRKEYDAEQGRKNDSRGTPVDLTASGA